MSSMEKSSTRQVNSHSASQEILCRSSVPCSQALPNPRPCLKIHNKLAFYGQEMLAPRHPQAAGSPLVVCSRLLSRYILRYPTHLEATSYNRNPRMCYVVVTGIHIT